MFNIEVRDYGLKLTFAGKIDAVEMSQWLKVCTKILENQDGEFSVFGLILASIWAPKTEPVEPTTIRPASNTVKTTALDTI